MVDISNKGLALILLVAVVISVGSTIYTVSKIDATQVVYTAGRATTNQSGKANFTIQSTLSIKFSDITTVAFGTGYVNDTAGPCTIGTNQTYNVTKCIGSWNATVASKNLTIENDGNIAANVTLNFSKNATLFINGTAPSFRYRVQANETNSCVAIMNGSAASAPDWKEVNQSLEGTNAGAKICNYLNQSDATDSISVALWLSIPDDAGTGDHVTDIYAIACDVGC